MTAFEVVAGRVTNPGATITALTANTGNTFTVRDFPESATAYIEEVWAQQATAGEVRLTSPRLHDNVQGLRFQSIAAQIRSFLGDEARQRVYANDVITYALSGGGAEVDSSAMIVQYSDLSGITQNLQTWDAVAPRIVDYMGHVVQVTGPTVAGDWSAGNALNSFSAQQKADNTYALLGYLCATAELAIGVAGADTGNLRVGGPGTTDPLETRNWFVRLSRNTGQPYIPILKANNFASSTLAVARNTTGGTDNVTLLFARLSS